MGRAPWRREAPSLPVTCLYFARTAAASSVTVTRDCRTCRFEVCVIPRRATTIVVQVGRGFPLMFDVFIGSCVLGLIVLCHFDHGVVPSGKAGARRRLHMIRLAK